MICDSEPSWLPDPDDPEPSMLASMDAPPESRMESYDALLKSDLTKLETRGLTSYRSSPKQQQLDRLWDRTIVKDQLTRRILSMDTTQPDGLALLRCHSKATRMTCKGCERSKVYWNRCERRYCPLCAPRLAKERQQQIEFWSTQIKRPKMLTLTARNVPLLTKEYLAWFKVCFRKLRAQKVWESVKGGMWSMEVTNQGRGWHVHLHVLIDAPFVPLGKIERAWSKLIRQAFAIVHIKELTGKGWIKEIVKYVSKPTEMIHWPDDQLKSYLATIDAVKMFGVFGTLYGARSEWTAFVASIRIQGMLCECGCSDWSFDAILDPPRCHDHPPRPGPQMSLSPLIDASWRHERALTN